MTISEVLSPCTYIPYDEKPPYPPQDLIDSVYNDVEPYPGEIDLITVKESNKGDWMEYYLLYKFPQSQYHLGENLKALGTVISKLPSDKYEMGIQEVDTSRGDGYYVLIYVLVSSEEMKKYNS